MEALIVYSQRNRKVARTARQIAENLRRQNHAVYVADVHKDGTQILAPYDAVVIGCTMWGGRIDRGVRKYIRANQQELLLKQTYLFVHTPVSGEKFSAQLAKQLPAEILAHLQVFNLGFDVQRQDLMPLQLIHWALLPIPHPQPEEISAVEQLVDIISEKRLDVMPIKS